MSDPTTRPVYELASELLGAASLKQTLAIVASDESVIARIDLLADAANSELARIDAEVAKLFKDRQAAYDRHLDAREIAIKSREDILAKREAALKLKHDTLENDRQYVARLKQENEIKARVMADVPLPEKMHQYDVMLPPTPEAPRRGRPPTKSAEIFS